MPTVVEILKEAAMSPKFKAFIEKAKNKGHEVAEKGKEKVEHAKEPVKKHPGKTGVALAAAGAAVGHAAGKEKKD